MCRKVLPLCLYKEYHDYIFPTFVEGQQAFWAPPDPVDCSREDMAAAMRYNRQLMNRTKLTLFYLVVHQKFANLRQAPHMLYTLFDRILTTVQERDGGEQMFKAMIQKVRLLLNVADTLTPRGGGASGCTLCGAN